MRRRRLTETENNRWCEIYWNLIAKGLPHIDAFELADHKIYRTHYLYKIIKV